MTAMRSAVVIASRLVVGDVDGRVAVFVVQAAHLEAHLLAQVGVEVGQRLVEQQRLGLDDQRAGQRHALLLAAGQLARIALGERRRAAWWRGSSSSLLAIVVAVELAQLQAVGDVFAPPSCAATARSSGRSSTCCAARAAACGSARTRRGRRRGSRPPIGSMKPAISRSVVVLPQPDGPSRQTSRPCSIASETLSTTASAVALGQIRAIRPMPRVPSLVARPPIAAGADASGTNTECVAASVLTCR